MLSGNEVFAIVKCSGKSSQMVGSLARISGALEEEGISIFVISSYFTDHLLVREKDVGRVIRKLESPGFVVVEKV